MASADPRFTVPILQRLAVHVVVPASVQREAVLKDAHLHVVHQSAEVSGLVYRNII